MSKKKLKDKDGNFNRNSVLILIFKSHIYMFHRVYFFIGVIFTCFIGVISDEPSSAADEERTVDALTQDLNDFRAKYQIASMLHIPHYL